MLIGGDVCPIGRNGPLFRDGNAAALFGDLLPYLVGADLVVVNLECPLIAESAPILKVGPVLGADRCSIRGIKAAGIHVVNLANNHILDHGASGLMSTIAVCEAEGIAPFGAGPDLAAASRPLIREINGLRIAFWGAAEHEFSIAGALHPGANPLALPAFVRMVRSQRATFDFLVVLLHGGCEDYLYPSPRLMDICRFMVEEGASAVVCQHSHCPGCYERYNGAPIVYGQGNLLFDSGACRMGPWTEGFLLGLTFEKGTESRIELIPYVQSGEQPGAQQVMGRPRHNLLSAIQARNDQIRDGDFVCRQWHEWCQEHRYEYIGRIRNYSRLLRFLNKRFHFSDYIHTPKFWSQLLNTVQCESHREVLEVVLEQELSSIDPRRPSGSSLGRSER